MLCKEKREGDQRLHIHLTFSLFLPGIMGKKFAFQTESCLVDEKVYMDTARFNLFRDSLRTARISEIDAENSALILRQVTKGSQLSLFRYFDKANLAVVLKNCRVAERVRNDERLLGLARLGLDPHTVSG